MISAVSRIKKGDTVLIKQRSKSAINYADDTYVFDHVDRGDIGKVEQVVYENMPSCVYCRKYHKVRYGVLVIKGTVQHHVSLEKCQI